MRPHRFSSFDSAGSAPTRDEAEAELPARARPARIVLAGAPELPDACPTDAGQRGMPLAERLQPLTADRASPAAALVLDTAQFVHAWLGEQPDAAGWDALGGALEHGLGAWEDEQGWRGTCALWLDALRRTCAWGRGARLAAVPRAVLVEELGLWLWGRNESAAGIAELDATWDGVPLAAGRRLPRRSALAAHAARELESGETVLATAYSHGLVLALAAAQRAGKRPTLLIGEALPHLDARRMARELVEVGVDVELCYDSALLAAVPRADRIWLSTEGIGVDAFLARVGTRVLLEEAERHEVPVAVLATSDKLIPGGELRLPEWAARDGWLLWEDAPAGVRLQSQFYEAVPLDLVPRFVTELGDESAAALHLRGLRLERAPRCAPTHGR